MRTPLWDKVNIVKNQVLGDLRRAIAADPGVARDLIDGVELRAKLRTAAVWEMKLKCELTENLAVIIGIVDGSTELIEDRLREGENSAVILLLGMEEFIGTMIQNNCFTKREVDMSCMIMGTKLLETFKRNGS